MIEPAFPLVPNVGYYVKFGLGYSDSNHQPVIIAESDVKYFKTSAGNDGFTELKIGVKQTFTDMGMRTYVFTAPEHGMYQFTNTASSGNFIIINSDGTFEDIYVTNLCRLKELEEGQTVYLYASGMKSNGNTFKPDGSVIADYASGTAVSDGLSSVEKGKLYSYTLPENSDEKLVSITITDSSGEPINDSCSLLYYPGDEGHYSSNERVNRVMNGGETLLFIPYVYDESITDIKIKITTVSLKAIDEISATLVPDRVTNRSALFNITASVSSSTAAQDVKLFMFYGLNDDIDVYDESTYTRRQEMDINDMSPCVDEQLEYYMSQFVPGTEYSYKFAIGYLTEDGSIVITACTATDALTTENGTGGFTTVSFGESKSLESMGTLAFEFTAEEAGTYQFTIDAPYGYVNIYNTDGSNDDQWYINDGCRVMKMEKDQTVYFFAEGWDDDGYSTGTIKVSGLSGTAVADGSEISERTFYSYTLSESEDKIIDIVLVDDDGNEITENVSFQYTNSGTLGESNIIRRVLTAGDTMYFVSFFPMDQYGELKIKVNESPIAEADSITVAVVESEVTNRSAVFDIKSSVMPSTSAKDGLRLFMFYGFNSGIDVENSSTYMGGWGNEYPCATPCTEETAQFEMSELLPGKTYYFRFAIGKYIDDDGNFELFGISDEVSLTTKSGDEGFVSVYFEETKEITDSDRPGAFKFTAPSDGIYRFELNCQENGFLTVNNADGTYADCNRISQKCSFVTMKKDETVYFFARSFRFDDLGSVTVGISNIAGDVNLDGTINVEDVYLLRKEAAGLITLNDDQKAVADIYTDGKYNALDVNLLRRFIAGIVTEIPYSVQ